jgi:hypothetical protein
MWVLLWIQMATASTVTYFHVGTYSSLERCEEGKERASVMVLNKDATVVCLDVTLGGDKR